MKLAFAALLAFTSLSHADRKSEPPPDKLAAAASDAFTKAKAADDKGDLDDAARLYRKALDISPHPFTQYNLADVLRRKKDIAGAIKGFKKYLEMDPKAKDRTEVLKLIAQLEAMPGKMVFEFEESDAQVFVNGEPVKGAKNKLELEMPAGEYSVDLVTAITHDNRRCPVYHGVKYGCRLSPRPREDGNVIISGPVNMSRASVGRSGRPTITFKGRFHLDPGRHQIQIEPRDECPQLNVEIAPGPVVTYVYAETPDKWPEKRGECANVKFKRRVLKF